VHAGSGELVCLRRRRRGWKAILNQGSAGYSAISNSILRASVTR
jgi:hypothetical protein